MAETARAAVHANDDVAGAQSKDLARSWIVDVNDVLYLEIMIARAERTHFTALPSFGGFGDLRRVGVDDHPALLDAFEIFGSAEALIHRPLGPATKHGVHFLR